VQQLTAELSEDERAGIFGGNAVTLYRLNQN
jgi:predicted TIM-barrel fold metal-dependent hydrolase